MNKYEIIKFNNDYVEVDVTVSPLEKTIWINIEHIAILFERERSIISKYIKISFQKVTL